MKLYFYELDTGNYFRAPSGIVCSECEVEEKPKTYVQTNGKSFPGYICRIKKEDVGRLLGYNQCVIAFTEPSFERAKEIFRNRELYHIKETRKKLDSHEGVLKIIEESEEKQWHTDTL